MARQKMKLQTTTEPSPITMKKTTAKSAEVWIYDSIGASFFEDGVTAKQFAKDIVGLGDVNAITVHINSPGGAVFEGLAIFNTLLSHPAHIVVEIDGMAASIASVIAMAGDEINMAANGMLVIHDPRAITIGTAEDMRRDADVLDKIKDTIVATYANRVADSEPSMIAAMMTQETWFTANEAKEAGFVDNVTGEKKIAASFDLSMFASVPDGVAERMAQNESAGEALRENKENDMPEKKTAIDPVAEFESDHSGVVDNWKAEAKKEGVTEGKAQGVKQERERFGKLVEAFSDRPAFACDQFAKGHDVETAKAELSGVQAEEIDDLKAKLAEAESKQVTDDDGHDGVEMSGKRRDKAPPKNEDVEAKARREWEANLEGCREGDNPFADYGGYLMAAVEEDRLVQAKLAAASQN